MSKTARRWCEDRGDCFTPTFPPLKKLSTKTRSRWEATFGSGIWHFRAAWFRKPTACLQSPFARTCWLDLDCEVRGSLEPIFHSLTFAEIALVADPTHRVDAETPRDEVPYNSGVVAFCKESQILHHWVTLASRENEFFVGDQEALSRAIYLHRPKLLELPPIYNWFKPLGPNPNALIIHHLCGCKAQLAHALRTPDTL